MDWLLKTFISSGLMRARIKNGLNAASIFAGGWVTSHMLPCQQVFAVAPSAPFTVTMMVQLPADDIVMSPPVASPAVAELVHVPEVVNLVPPGPPSNTGLNQ